MKFLNSAIILNLNYTPKAFLARQECESNILGSAKRNWISLAVEIHCLATVWYTYTLLILLCWDLRLYMTCSQRRRRVVGRIGLKLCQVWTWLLITEGGTK